MANYVSEEDGCVQQQRYLPLASADPNAIGRDDFMVWRAFDWCSAPECSESVVTRSLRDVHAVSVPSRSYRKSALRGAKGYVPFWFRNTVLLAAFLRAVEARLLPRHDRRRAERERSSHDSEWHSMMRSALT